MEQTGLDDFVVKKEHLNLLLNGDIKAKLRAIDLYYKLRGLYKNHDDKESQLQTELEVTLDRISSLLPK